MLEYLRESEICYRISEFYSTSAQTVVKHGGTYKTFQAVTIYRVYEKSLIKRDTSCDIIIKI